MKQKKMGFVVVLALLTGVVFLGCAKSREVRVAVEGDTTVGVIEGQMVKIELEANATTGYIWDLEGPFNEEILRQIGKYRYLHKSRRIGEGGTQLYRFDTLKKGQTKLVFEYKRPWEKEKKPAKKYVVRVIVH